MADNESDTKLKKTFEHLVESEMDHARKWAAALGIDKSLVVPTASFWKLWFYKTAVNWFGTKSVVSWLVRFETKEVEDYISDPDAADLVQDERYHLRILNRLVNDGDDVLAMREKGYGGIADGGRLRAAVLGVNDGLVSNFCLVMGVSGGIDQQEFVLIAGVAGLLAGAFSMAAGEYVSMRSQRDIFEHRLNTAKEELKHWPEDELNDIKLIYAVLKVSTKTEFLNLFIISFGITCQNKYFSLSQLSIIFFACFEFVSFICILILSNKNSSQ